MTITQTLCDQARAGDQAAYERLWTLHVDRAHLFVRARLGPHLRSSLESQDILQDAFLAAHRDFNAFEYRDEGSFFHWLCRIIENRIRDRKDHAQAAKRQPVALPQSDPTGPITALDRKLDRERILVALDRLEPDHRQAVLLKYFEGLSSEEIGTRLQRSPGAARKLLARALVELGKHLTPEAVI
jgi:RNA polymerase sigma-70 factor (ECF subfamily)